MKKEDFKKGQEVYVYKSRDSWGCEERLIKATVASVGRKYITVSLNRWENVKFDIHNQFIEASCYSPRYTLYLSREQREEDVRITNKCKKIFDFFGTYSIRDWSEEDLDTIIGIIEKHKN